MKKEIKDSDELIKLTNYYIEDGDDYNGMPINNRFKEVWVKKSELEKIKPRWFIVSDKK